MKAKSLCHMARSKVNMEERVRMFRPLVGKGCQSSKQEWDLSIGPNTSAHLGKRGIPMEIRRSVL